MPGAVGRPCWLCARGWQRVVPTPSSVGGREAWAAGPHSIPLCRERPGATCAMNLTFDLSACKPPFAFVRRSFVSGSRRGHWPLRAGVLLPLGPRAAPKGSSILFQHRRSSSPGAAPGALPSSPFPGAKPARLQRAPGGCLLAQAPEEWPLAGLVGHGPALRCWSLGALLLRGSGPGLTPSSSTGAVLPPLLAPRSRVPIALP